jgi:hypothetical protein
MRRGFDNLRNLAGMSLAPQCAAYYWMSWLAWTAAVLGLLLAEYTWRVPNPPGGYLGEALVAMLAWPLALALADHTVVHVYLHTWQALQHHGQASELLSEQKIEDVRDELRGLPLLSWVAPPPARDIGAQLLSATLWFAAVTRPTGTRAWQRYGEWFIDVLAGFIPLAIACAAALIWPTRYGLASAAALGALGLSVLGYSALRFTARRQAVLDYFNAWRSDGQTDSDQPRSGAEL